MNNFLESQEENPQPPEERRKLAVLAIAAVRKSLGAKRANNCCAMCGKDGLVQLIQVEFESSLHAVCRRCALSVRKAERWRMSRWAAEAG